MQLVPLRRRSFGQDGTDTIDTSVMDTSAPIPSVYSIPDVAPPDIGISAPTDIYAGIGPAAPGEVVLPSLDVGGPSTPDLPSLILSGQLPPPSGGGLSSDQVAQIAAAGGTPSDIQAILAGQASPSAVLKNLQAGISIATQVKTLVSSPTPGRATPMTVPTAAAGATIGATSIAQPLSALTKSSIVAGVPNWMVGAVALLGVAAVASAFGGKR